jgi:hypothetical protein
MRPRPFKKGGVARRQIFRFGGNSYYGVGVNKKPLLSKEANPEF